MTAYLTSLFFVVLAEMGDKTQLLAVAFATCYRWQTVMGGVLAATLVNHLFAVFIGSYLTHWIPMEYIQIAAAASFIGFGLWTIRGDDLGGGEMECSYNPFWTVFAGFFMAEMGDKTQLATVALAAQFNTIIPVWLGTTTGMIIADGVGILAGATLGRKIPAKVVKWLAATVFIIFGLGSLYISLPQQVLTLPVIAGGLVLLGWLIYKISRREKIEFPLRRRTL
ncbi:Hypothetical protein LUCI_0271 [Lucifera butyrica]|uniref:GDT1 family protein n=1 Tax=Lucifera butyrica TaxID=1351585 RepID=A0A498R1M7_9FIRM|nr:TMEM165/GDT1 family protein [Lucifera butyrica]VBB05065.1 Hypothetical protein LUCI_0271 [Lucifera butyrica]